MSLQENTKHLNGKKLNFTSMEEVVKTGNINVIKHYYEDSHPLWGHSAGVAIINGYQEILDWIYNVGGKNAFTYQASLCANKTQLQWLKNRDLIFEPPYKRYPSMNILYDI
jgi:hypothetical protein